METYLVMSKNSFMRLPDVCCNCSCKESQSLTALSVSIRLHLSMNPDAILSNFTQLVVQLFLALINALKFEAAWDNCKGRGHANCMQRAIFIFRP